VTTPKNSNSKVDFDEIGDKSKEKQSPPFEKKDFSRAESLMNYNYPSAVRDKGGDGGSLYNTHYSARLPTNERSFHKSRTYTPAEEGDTEDNDY